MAKEEIETPKICYQTSSMLDKEVSDIEILFLVKLAAMALSYHPCRNVISIKIPTTCICLPYLLPTFTLFN